MENDIIKQINEVLEDMCLLGSIMKEEIIEEKKVILKNLYQFKKQQKKKIKVKELSI